MRSARPAPISSTVVEPPKSEYNGLSMSNPTFPADDGDPGLAEASVRARSTFRYFWRELSWEYRRIVPAIDLAAVKFAFADGDAVEHMWVGDVVFDGELVSGALMNEPCRLTNIREGDVVALPLDRVEDWMLTMDREVFGAFTVNAMRARMKQKERRAHDEAWGVSFGDPGEVRLPSTEDDHPMALNARGSLVAHLVSHPEDVTATDDRRFTILHRESLAGNGKLVAVALEHGADVRAVTRGGKTALALARGLGWSSVEEILVRAGGEG
jgi:uncharacterized protein